MSVRSAAGNTAAPLFVVLPTLFTMRLCMCARDAQIDERETSDDTQLLDDVLLSMSNARAIGQADSVRSSLALICRPLIDDASLYDVSSSRAIRRGALCAATSSCASASPRCSIDSASCRTRA